MKLNAPNYDQMEVRRPHYDDVAATYEQIRTVLADDPVQAVKQWDVLRRELSAYESLVGLKYAQDTTDPKIQEERNFSDEFFPRIAELSTSMKRDLLQHRATLEKEFGAHIFDLWQADIATFEPQIEQDMVDETKTSKERGELVASAEVTFEGESLNLSQLQGYVLDVSRDRRESATRTYWDWYEERGEQFDDIYDRLVSIRTSMAKKLGMKNYIELGYLRMQRIDYDAAAVENFREEVLEHVVPAATLAVERQAEALGIDEVKVWDHGVYSATGAPAPRGEYEEQIQQAHTMFERIHPELAEFFAMMDKRGLMDLVARKGKVSGGFCTSLEDGVPFIFANFNGTRGDIDTFTHEVGHAFQCWLSRKNEPLDLVWPTLESCEIHSMSLEYFCAPHMELFYGEDADQVRRDQLIGSLTFLPYGVAIDHFQHLVYGNPDATPADRREMWLQMQEKYMPWRKADGIPHLEAGGWWHRQGHVFGSPFYYIDYVLAETVALQFWARMQTEHDAALADYVALCRRGGSGPFQELVKSVSLQSPFERGSLKSAVAAARESLDL